VSSVQAGGLRDEEEDTVHDPYAVPRYLPCVAPIRFLRCCFET
jgi:hypothetical protein